MKATATTIVIVLGLLLLWLGATGQFTRLVAFFQAGTAAFKTGQVAGQVAAGVVVGNATPPRAPASAIYTPMQAPNFGPALATLLQPPRAAILS